MLSPFYLPSMSPSFGLSIVTLSFKVQLLPFLSCKLFPNYFSPLDYFSKCGVGVEWERERQREKSHFLKGAIMVFSRLAAFSGTKKLIDSLYQGKQIWTFLNRGTPGHATLWLWWIETWVGLTQVVEALEEGWLEELLPECGSSQLQRPFGFSLLSVYWDRQGPSGGHAVRVRGWKHS